MEQKIKIVLACVLLVLALVGVATAQVNTTISNQTISNQTIQENSAAISTPSFTESGNMGELISVKLYPEKQVANIDEPVKYTLVIQDKHPKIPCIPEEPKICEKKNSYRYELYAEKSKGMVIEFHPEIDRNEDNTLILLSGETRKVSVGAKSKNAGANYFAIRVVGGDTSSYTKGVLLVSDRQFEQQTDGPSIQYNYTDTEIESIPESVDNSYFIGRGFTLSLNEISGDTIDLKIIKGKEGKITGKIVVRNEILRIEGSSFNENTTSKFDENITFQIFSPEQSKFQTDNIGSFSGFIKKFDTFYLLRGNLITSKGIYTLTAISENKNIFKEVNEEDVKEKFVNTKVKEVIVMKKTQTEVVAGENETYVRTVKIEKEKFLKIIPNPWGKKVIEVEITESDKVYKDTIGQDETKKIGSYNIQVGDLSDENNVEVKIKKSE